MSAVPLFASSLEPYHDRLTEALDRVARSGRYILGPEVEAFEEEFARYLGVRHCIGVANGTDALTIALRALGVGPGDEVVMPSFTFYATAEAALVLGARPVFCDIDPETFCVTRETVEAALTPRTKAIVPVHLFGNVAPVAELRELGVPVIEDAAQAAGADARRREGRRARRRRDVLVLPVEEPALPRRRRRDHDRRRRAGRARAHPALPRLEGQATFTEVGYNSRLDELQAAVLRVLLPELDGWTTARRGGRRGVRAARARRARGAAAARRGRAARLPPLRRALGARAAGRARLLPHAGAPPAGDRLGRRAARTEEAARTNYALPMGTDLTEEQVREVVECVSGST